MRESLGEYARAVAKWWWIVTVGVIAAIVGVVQSVSGLAGGPVWVWVILAFAGLSIAQFVAFHESRKELAASKGELVGLQVQINELKAQPNLEIVTGVGSVFRQERRVRSSEGFPMKETVCRVGIRHDGNATVDNVSVDLESMKPHSLPVPLLLHQMNDNPPTRQFKQDFSLDGGETKYVDVVLEQHDDEEQPTRDRVLLLRRARGVTSRLLIFHIVPGVSQDIPVGRHEIVIFAHGHDAKPVRQNFIIDVDDNGKLQFASA